MYNSLLGKQFEALEQGIGKATDEGDAKALEVVFLDQFIQIHAERSKN